MNPEFINLAERERERNRINQRRRRQSMSEEQREIECERRRSLYWMRAMNIPNLQRHGKGTRVFIPRIPLKTAEDAKLPFDMTRRTFPVRLIFAITINKSQGQTIPNVGIYLPNHVFSHGQLYVALSRGVSSSTTKILVSDGLIDGEYGVYTKNVVYKEIFSKLTPPANVA